MHGIYFILRFRLQNPAPGPAATRLLRGPPNQAEHRNLATGPKVFFKHKSKSKPVFKFNKLTAKLYPALRMDVTPMNILCKASWKLMTSCSLSKWDIKFQLKDWYTCITIFIPISTQGT